MTVETVYSICGMCTIRCPVAVEVRGGRVKHIWGNPHALGGHQLCPRGAAGKVFEYDDERPRAPMVRQGERGAGDWKEVSWDEALDRIADTLATIKQESGSRALVLSDRGGPHREFHRTFLNAYGSPNYLTHHATCSNSVHNGHMFVAGLPRNGVAYDYKRCRHLVAFGRNIFQSIGTGEAKNVIDLLERGDAFTFFDVRWNFTAAKATRFHLVRPGTDYAIVLALAHVLLRDRLAQAEFVEDWVTGQDEFRTFVEPYTPEFAAEESGVAARDIVRLAHELAEQAPHVIVHPGWMTAWGERDFYLRRALYALNALLGTYEAPGGLVIPKGPGDCGVKLRQLTSQAPKPETTERFDGIGVEPRHLGKGWGMVQLLPEAATSGKPYPLRAYFAVRHDPLASLPDPAAFRKGLDALDLVVSLDVNWSETAWYADIVLPEATYLERTDNVIVRKGLKPKLALRRQAVEPRFDARPRWWIFKQLAERLGLGEHFPYETIEDHIAWQLEETPYSLSDFDETGEIDLSGSEIWFDRREGIPFKTPSGKIELGSRLLEDAGVESWVPYEPPAEVGEDGFRLITGKTAVHTQGRTTANNALLHELVPDNPVCIHPDRAGPLGISTGDEIVVVSAGGHEEIGTAEVSDLVHPEVAYTLHGFGDSVPLRTRSHGRGLSDVRLMTGKLQATVGGNCPNTDTVVRIRRKEEA